MHLIFLLFALVSLVSSQRASMGADAASNLLLKAAPSKSVIAKAPLSVEGSLTATGRFAVSGCSSGLYNCIGTSAVAIPISPFITASNDLYVEGDLEAQRIVARSNINAGGCSSSSFHCIALSTPIGAAVPASISTADDLFVGGDLRASLATFVTSVTTPAIVTNTISSSGVTAAVADSLSVSGSISTPSFINALSFSANSVAVNSISTAGGLAVTLGGTFGGAIAAASITTAQGITGLSVIATSFLRTGGPLRAGGACNNTAYHCMSNTALPANNSFLQHIGDEDDLFVGNGGYFGGLLVANELRSTTSVWVSPQWKLENADVTATLSLNFGFYAGSLTFRSILIQAMMTGSGRFFSRVSVDSSVLIKRAETASVLQRVTQLAFFMKEHDAEASRTETAKRTEGPLPTILTLPASEWKRAFPEAVAEIEDQTLVMESYAGMISLAAVKELAEKNEHLTAAVEELRTKNDQLAQAVEELRAQMRQLLEANTNK